MPCAVFVLLKHSHTLAFTRAVHNGVAFRQRLSCGNSLQPGHTLHLSKRASCTTATKLRVLIFTMHLHDCHVTPRARSLG